jgi:hypothetical protein
LGGSRFEASPGKQFCETLSWKNPSQKRAGGVALGEGPEFKLQYLKKKKKGGGKGMSKRGPPVQKTNANANYLN